jgi:hypothetical protein
LQNGLLTETEAKGFHVADETALPVANGGQRFGKALPIPVKAGPVVQFVDIHSLHLLRRL